MPLFLSILEGRSPRTARPLLATSDRALIELVRRELWHRLATDAPDDGPDPPISIRPATTDPAPEAPTAA